ncbi:hypothetical protein KUV50_09140 [Membranicola marinus]|uniref:Organic solvent tolerance-like N-terminal domain-containing protein n=1 Tax=Membranihabitans marinus TaxID=1227546 RepID=A0A953HUV5_9BACT|nr:OstA-like protein [Membranihabitans marinus]MBY5958293.1 hypothetical protein [Membranihabitans marinus]
MKHRQDMVKVNTHYSIWLYTILYGMLVGGALLGPQTAMGQDAFTRPETDTLKQTTIILDEPADRVRLFTKDSVQYQELTGNVRMRHDSTFMRTDSAILDDRNQVEAYGNVVIQELDSTYIFADTLWYNGNTRIAELRGEVVLEKDPQRLFTPHLFYNLETKIAHYNEKSYMMDADRQLSSLNGVFYVGEDRVIFRDSVLVISDSFNLKADSMAFFTQEHKVQFLGPTVVYNDTSRLYAEDGYYLLDEEEALFYNSAQFLSGATLGRSDSIYYFGKEGRYEMIGQAYLKKDDQVATARKIIYEEQAGLMYLFGEADVRGDDVNATGDTLVYNTETKAIRSRGRSRVERTDFTLQSEFLDYNDETQQGVATGNVIWADSSGSKRIFTDSLQYSNDGQTARALSIRQRPLFEWSSEEGDTLRLVSDTLFTYQTIVSGKDTLGQQVNDTTQDFSAYYDVAILREDMQGRADSLSYKESDSLIILYGNPILWMDTTQLSGDTIFISMVEGEVKDVLIKGNGFIITSPDSIFFNQIKGRKITAYFKDGDLYQTDVEGNAESIYFPLDEAGRYIAMNKIICSRIEMTFENNTVTGVAFLENPTGDLISMKEVNAENSILKGYQNLNQFRPSTMENERVLTKGDVLNMKGALKQ